MNRSWAVSHNEQCTICCFILLCYKWFGLWRSEKLSPARKTQNPKRLKIVSYLLTSGKLIRWSLKGLREATESKMHSVPGQVLMSSLWEINLQSSLAVNAPCNSWSWVSCGSVWSCGLKMQLLSCGCFRHSECGKKSNSCTAIVRMV